MKRLTIGALLIIFIVMISACSNGTDSQKEPAKETATPATADVKGDEVFQKSCIACHSSGDITGGPTTLDSAKIHNDFKTEEDLSSFVSSNMPKSAPGSLSKEEYTAVVKYLWDQK
ncbi:c-type cytochrome [Neobacillus sp. Marseille-QA0830]